LISRARPDVQFAGVLEPLEPRTFLSAVALRTGVRPHLSNGSATNDGYTYFQAFDVSHGHELWRTDGTRAGTTLVKDINPAVGTTQGYGSFPASFMVFNGAMLFTATDNAAGPDGLWRTDGTPEGTYKLAPVSDPYTANGREGWYVFRGELIGLGSDGLVATDGTLAGTRLMVDSPGASSLVGTIDRLYWLDGDGLSVRAYDGTTALTAAQAPPEAVEPVLTSSFGSGVTYAYTVFDGGEPHNERITLAPRERVVRPLNEQFHNAHGGDELDFRGAKFFSDSQGRLWRRGRVPAGDVLLHHIIAGSLTVARDALYFASGRQLWTSDGTAAGTRLVRDFASFPTGPRDLVGTRNALYFVIEETPNTLQPWRSDGTAAGTVRAADVGPHSPPDASLFGLARHNSNVLVGVRDGLYMLTGVADERRATHVLGPSGATDGLRTTFATSPVFAEQRERRLESLL
jgi:ELWxxDGT repeat protein